jgi:hypothetical protein
MGIQIGNESKRRRLIRRARRITTGQVKRWGELEKTSQIWNKNLRLAFPRRADVEQHNHIDQRRHCKAELNNSKLTSVKLNKIPESLGELGENRCRICKTLVYLSRDPDASG